VPENRAKAGLAKINVFPIAATHAKLTSTMGSPAAKQGDIVSGMDTHILMIPSPGGPVPTPTPMPFVGTISGELASSVSIDNMAAATKGSTADNIPSHIPAGGTFQKSPANKATVQEGSATVFLEDKPAARMGDPAMTCNDPEDAPNGTVIASSTVFIG
jgi:uncharacterized Zn-binding protein involved in type VI secretion